MIGEMEKHWGVILRFWRLDGATNVVLEGFNNKVRMMLRQAYGYRKDEYMMLKIFDLPNRKLQVSFDLIFSQSAEEPHLYLFFLHSAPCFFHF